jgi:hypothetical protein
MSEDRLNDNFFKKLHDALPGFKKQYAEQMRTKRAEAPQKGKLKQPPCLACGKRFGSKVKEFIITDKPTLKPFCPSCQTRLDNGETALVNIVAERYFFVDFKVESIFAMLSQKFPEFKDCKLSDVRGKSKVVSDAFLDFITHLYPSPEKN